MGDDDRLGRVTQRHRQWRAGCGESRTSGSAGGPGKRADSKERHRALVRHNYYLLEEDFECWLLNAQHLHNVPGRKTDVADAAWIAQLLEVGLSQGSFVPAPALRELRDLTRYRERLVQDRTREGQRVEKVLEDAGIKLASVASQTLGKSGRAMIDALIAGERDPLVLAELAKKRLRAKIPELQRALIGRFGEHHAVMLRLHLAHIDQADATIERLSIEIERVIAPFEAAVTLLMTIPGVHRRTAECLLAECGTDMTRFRSPAHLASWAGMCPGNNESAGKQRSGRTTVEPVAR